VIYTCCNENRRAAIIGNPTLNGIDYLEVLDNEAPLGSPRQQTLLVHCLKSAPTNLTPANVLIEGGESITGITTSSSSGLIGGGTSGTLNLSLTTAGAA